MRKKILIIDDSLPILTLLTSMFDNKYEVINKNSALSAILWLQEGNLPDLIITDLNMPEMDGQTFIQQLKASTFFHTIPVVVLSSNQGASDKVKLLKLGVEDYVNKPFNPEELILRTENLLRRNLGSFAMA